MASVRKLLAGFVGRGALGFDMYREFWSSKLCSRRLPLPRCCLERQGGWMLPLGMLSGGSPAAYSFRS